jgi:hypothetical protein
MAAVLEGLVLVLSDDSARKLVERAIKLRVRGLYFVPITPDVRRRHEHGPEDGERFGDFHELSKGAAEWARVRSIDGPVLYIHVEFHGGQGFHAAIGWRHGEVAFGPSFTETSRDQGALYQVAPVAEMAINRGLRALGMAVAEDGDEFQVVGLDRHRWNDEWLSQAD